MQPARLARDLPEPPRGRWQPLRSGILNLYRIDEQEFWYEQGRLLLRGNNGTGKSRVLALQLPFLIDGDVSPHRVEPDRDPAKRMEWNLLLNRFKNRRGYTWIEFGRRDDEGEAHYLTLGCGLQAVEGRGITSRWFFVTPWRMGVDLTLVTPNGQPLTRDQLADMLQQQGQVFTTAQEYRRAVDRALFALGDQRYGSLVDLLITLRQPQLTRTLDEEALSRALGEALPPLSFKIIEDVAESMRGLEADRDQLESHRAAAQAITDFLGTYERYARVASRRKSDAVRQTHSKFEAIGRELKATETNLESAVANSAAIDLEIADLKVAEAGAETEQETLRSSPQMAVARELNDAKREAEERGTDAERAKRDDEQAAADLRLARQNLDQAEGRAREFADASGRAISQAAGRAELIGMERVHGKVLSEPALVTPSDESVDTAKSAIEKAIESRRCDRRALRSVCLAADAALGALIRAKQERDRAASNVDAAQDQLDIATDAINDRHAALISDYRKWFEQLVEARPLPPDELTEPMQDWVQTGSGESPQTSAIRGAVVAAAERLAHADADLRTQETAAGDEISALEGKRDGLLAGEHESPPPPHTRDVVSRELRPGAPLWALCEFEETATDQERAGLEAAMEASGLLDAWVLPSGEVLDAKTFDSFLTPADESELSEAESLRSRLRPCTGETGVHSAVDEQVVSSVLRVIGLGESVHRIWVHTDGSWRNGPLSGRWGKSAPEHVGATAREARRLRRLRELEEQIRVAQQRLENIGQQRAVLDQRRSTLQGEIDAAPRDDAIRDALAAASEARRVLAAARTRLAQVDLSLAEAHANSEAALAQRDQTARDLGLEKWIDRLDELDEAITRYRDACGDVWSALRRHVDALARVSSERTRLEQSERIANDRRARAQQAVQRAQSAQSRYRTLEQTKGAEVKEVVARLESVKTRLSDIRAHKEHAINRSREAAGQVARLEERAAELGEQRHEHERIRDNAVELFRAFITTGVLGIAVPSARSLAVHDWSTTRLVDLAREIEQEGAAADDAAWQQCQNQLFERFKDLEDELLKHDHRPDLRPAGDVFVVRAVFQGRQCAIDELHTVLEDEVAQRQMLLDAKEREILENHLIGEVAQHLHDRLRHAEQLVRQMNGELERVPTSSGMVLRFRWEPKDDGPGGLADARQKLMSAVGTWSPQEREAVGRFLQERIKAERLANDTGTWQEQLTSALDYRAWHNFVVERNMDGHWKRLTRRTHGTASGGEKAIALMIPMFAAAASHYRSAATTSPRLILLDEAFVGVDPEMRAKCMGLLRAFDLDFIMTSEHEWGCYSTLPGVAICQLSARPGLDGVYVSRWVWNGRERIQSPIDAGPAPAKMGLSAGGNDGHAAGVG